MTDLLYGWDSASQRFRDLSTGRFISERSVRDFVDNIADAASQQLGDLAARYRTGQITMTIWQAESRAVIKSSQIASALAAYGGRGQMTPARWGVVGQQIRTQYAYLTRFADDVLSGRQRLNGRMDARARMYGQASRTLYENIRRRESAASGQQFERNIRHAVESCGQCVNQSSLGWQPIGTLVPVGQRSCRSSCRCTLAYSRTMVMDSEAA